MEGRFNGGFFALPVWGAYIWRGLFSEFYGILFESEKYYCPQPTGKREPWERGFLAPLQNMEDGIDLTDVFARLRNSLLDLSRRLQCNASEDMLDFVSFHLKQIL